METLLVCMMIGVISVAVYQALSNGLKIWERSRMFSVEEDMMLFFDRFAMDLRNGFNFSLFEFEADPDRVVFSTLVSVPMSSAGSGDSIVYAEQIGRVEYGFDSSAKAVYSRRAHYGQAVKGSFGAKKILVPSVRRMSLKYFERGQLGPSEQKLELTALPAAIEVTMEYGDGQGQIQRIIRMINLPLSL